MDYWNIVNPMLGRPVADISVNGPLAGRPNMDDTAESVYTVGRLQAHHWMAKNLEIQLKARETGA
jgi:hypothetical protein